MNSLVQSLLATLGVWIPRVLAALLILAIGWFVAKLVASVVRKVLGMTKLDNRLAGILKSSDAPAPKVENLVAQVLFYVILFIAILAALNALGLAEISALFNSMLGGVFAYLPKLVYAAVLAGVAWLVATVLRAVVTRVLQGVGVDRRLGEQAGAESAPPISRAIGEVVYWLIWLLFLPVILNVLGFAGLLAPVQTMLNGLLGFLPNLLAAAIILVVGLFVARIVQRIVAAALHAFGADALSDRMGLAKNLGPSNLSGLIGYVVYVLIAIPVVLAALDALKLAALTAPITQMLNLVLSALPNVFAAVVVLIVAYFIGRILADLIATLLKSAGFDNILPRMGVGAASVSRYTPSQLVGYLVLVALMLFASLVAAEMLQWAALVLMINQFIAFLGRLVLAVIVLIIGIYLANLIAKIILATEIEQKHMLALIARVAIFIFAVAMALNQTGIANDIVNMAFGLFLAAAALAAALAFGLGGRDVAKYQLVRWYKALEATLEEDKKE